MKAQKGIIFVANNQKIPLFLSLSIWLLKFNNEIILTLLFSLILGLEDQIWKTFAFVYRKTWSFSLRRSLTTLKTYLNL